jgi:hypothetical protein
LVAGEAVVLLQQGLGQVHQTPLQALEATEKLHLLLESQ